MHVEAQRLLARRRMLVAMRLGQQAEAPTPGPPRAVAERGPSSAAPAAADDGPRPPAR